MLSVGLRKMLIANSGLAALIEARIYPVRLPMDPVLPAITYHQIGGSSDPTFETSGLQKVRLQLDCWGDTYTDANDTRDALRQALNGFQGLLSDGTYLQNADLIQSTDFDEEDALQFRCMSEYYLYFTFSS